MTKKDKATFVLSSLLPVVAIAVYIFAAPAPAEAGDGCIWNSGTYSVGACIRSCSNNTGQKCLSGGSWGQCNGC